MRVLKAVPLGLGVAFLAAQLLKPERTNPPSDPAASFEAVVKPICEEVTEGNMPPKYYTPLHRDSRLTATDVGALCGLGGS